MLPEDAILLPEIVDEIFLVAIHPASQSQHEEVQSVGHGRRLHGSDAAVTHVVSRIHSPRPFSRTIRARLLRDSQHPRHDRRRAAGEDSQAVPTQPAVERSRWDDQKDQHDWAPSMEEGGRLSSTGPRRERVLPVQVDSRRSTSKSDSRSASCRIGACVQRAQSNDRAWSTRVVRDRSVTNLRVGALGASFDLRNNADARAPHGAAGCRSDARAGPNGPGDRQNLRTRGTATPVPGLEP